jgi:hypothetical protein
VEVRDVPRVDKAAVDLGATALAFEHAGDQAGALRTAPWSGGTAGEIRGWARVEAGDRLRRSFAY